MGADASKDKIDAARDSGAEHLALDELSLRSFPEDACALKALTSLSVRQNQLSEVPILLVTLLATELRRVVTVLVERIHFVRKAG